MFRIPDNKMIVSRIILSLRKVEFIKWMNLINVLFIGFVALEIMQLFSPLYQDKTNFVVLDCGLLKIFFWAIF